MQTNLTDAKRAIRVTGTDLFLVAPLHLHRVEPFHKTRPYLCVSETDANMLIEKLIRQQKIQAEMEPSPKYSLVGMEFEVATIVTMVIATTTKTEDGSRD